VYSIKLLIIQVQSRHLQTFRDPFVLQMQHADGSWRGLQVPTWRRLQHPPGVGSSLPSEGPTDIGINISNVFASHELSGCKGNNKEAINTCL